jgi:hypothetical protein
VVDDLEAGIETSDSYTVAEAVTDWLSRGTREFDESTVTTYRFLAEKNLIPLIGAGFAMPGGGTRHCHQTVTGPPRSG